MFFSQKIYYNNKPLILTNNRDIYIQQHGLAVGYLHLTGAFPRNYRLAIEHLNSYASLGAIIEDVSQTALLEALHAIYKPVDAGGGVVVSEKGDVLMILRRGKWDLPKGKRDEGEDIANCALREVAEETGLMQLTLGEKICDTFHVYAQNGQNLLKCTSWFRMSGSSGEPLVPQREENIIEAKWIRPDKLGLVVFKSFEAIREVLTLAGFRW